MIHRPHSIRSLPLLDKPSFLNPTVKPMVSHLFVPSNPLGCFHVHSISRESQQFSLLLYLNIMNFGHVWLLSKILVCIVGKHTSHCTHKQVREQLAGLSSLFYPVNSELRSSSSVEVPLLTYHANLLSRQTTGASFWMFLLAGREFSHSIFSSA